MIYDNQELKLQNKKDRLLILVVAYHAESTIKEVLQRIPVKLKDALDIEILILDDASKDKTFEISEETISKIPFPARVLYNPVNQGYGGNQKIGYHYAIKEKFDFVALLHGDGQYAPECLEQLVAPLIEKRADAVFGSRMMDGSSAIKGGMPLYKFIGNKVLTWFQNLLLRSRLTEFHSGYRVYSVQALKALPFDLNTNDFYFDTEIIIQFLFSNLKIIEVPIPTYYGDEICRVNGLKYAGQVILAVIRARAQAMGIFFSQNYDCLGMQLRKYQSKFNFKSPHSLAVKYIAPGSGVLDLGCAGGYVGHYLKEKKECFVLGVDCLPLNPENKLDHFIEHDLDHGLPKNIDWEKFDYVLLLDVLEHLSEPEKFVRGLHEVLGLYPHIKIIASTGNVAFGITRLMLLFGQFNYGPRGILDMTHKRLFTFATFEQLFSQRGFLLGHTSGVPAPFPLVFGRGIFSDILLAINELAIAISRSIFSYQIFCLFETAPSLDYLLAKSIEASNEKKLSSMAL